MKKERTALRLALIVSMILAMCSIFACKKSETKEDDLSGYKTVQIPATWLQPPSLEFLEKESQAVIVGKVIQREDSFSSGTEVGKTFYKDKVQKVLYGELNDNASEIRVHQSWSFQTAGDGSKQIVTLSQMEPLRVGDTWVFFVKYGAGLDAYQIMFDQNGCWPLADSKLVKLLETKMTIPTEEVASYWRSYENIIILPIYYEILEKYGDQIKP